MKILEDFTAFSQYPFLRAIQVTLLSALKANSIENNFKDLRSFPVSSFYAMFNGKVVLLKRLAKKNQHLINNITLLPIQYTAFAYPFTSFSTICYFVVLQNNAIGKKIQKINVDSRNNNAAQINTPQVLLNAIFIPWLVNFYFLKNCG